MRGRCPSLLALAAGIQTGVRIGSSERASTAASVARDRESREKAAPEGGTRRSKARTRLEQREPKKPTARLAKQNEARAKALAKIATSRQLAALSVAERDKRFDRSLLLAVEALQAENTFEARDSLYNALQERPGLTSFLHIDEGNVQERGLQPRRQDHRGRIRSSAAVGGGWCCGTWPHANGWATSHSP